MAHKVEEFPTHTKILMNHPTVKMNTYQMKEAICDIVWTRLDKDNHTRLDHQNS